jgi:hypothetical protein
VYTHGSRVARMDRGHDDTNFRDLRSDRGAKAYILTLYHSIRVVPCIIVRIIVSCQSNLDLRTQLVKNGCIYCKKYLNRGMDSHRLTCEVVQLVNHIPKKNCKNFTIP